MRDRRFCYWIGGNSLTIGGKAARVIYAGSAPGQIAGVMKVELVVPTGAGTGGVPVVLSSSGASSTAASVYLK